MKILFLAPYPVGKAPSQRLKYEQYYKRFQNEGYRIQTSSFVNYEFWKVIYKHGKLLPKIYFTFVGYFKRIFDLLKLRKYDIVYVHLWVTPLGPPIFEWLVRKLARKLIYDIDDLIYMHNQSKFNNFISLIKGRNKPLYLMKKADHVIVCTPKLETIAKKYNHRVTDISSTIDTDVYLPKVDYSIQKPILGWSGSHSTSKYLKLLKEPLLKLKKEVDFKLLVIGDKHFDIQGLDVEAIEWEEKEEIEQLKRIDIGLYPLPNEPWVYGKSGLKALQYMALGIPTIATAIGANYRIIENNKSGYLVESHDQWIKVILMLLSDKELRKRIGEKAREMVQNKYSIDANYSTYIQILRNI